jgi:Zn ribbon nucleic-acid-binding protein
MFSGIKQRKKVRVTTLPKLQHTCGKDNDSGFYKGGDCPACNAEKQIHLTLNVTMRRVEYRDCVRAYQCGCSAVMLPKLQIAHKMQCKHPQANVGQLINIPDPRLWVIQTSRGGIVVEGLPDLPAEKEMIEQMAQFQSVAEAEKDKKKEIIT